MNTPLFPPTLLDPAPTRRVCAVFMDLVDSTGLACSLPLAQFTTLMTELLQVLMLHTEARGGWALSQHGDGLLSLWNEEDAAFALEAAVEAHDRAARLGIARRLGLNLQMRVGVAAGEVMLGDLGREMTAYGLPLILARRLCDAGAPGETLVCGTMRERVPAARMQELPPAAFQGFAAPLPSYRCAGANHVKMNYG